MPNSPTNQSLFHIFLRRICQQKLDRSACTQHNGLYIFRPVCMELTGGPSLVAAVIHLTRFMRPRGGSLVMVSDQNGSQTLYHVYVRKKVQGSWPDRLEISDESCRPCITGSHS